jgi:hypothetical protein
MLNKFDPTVNAATKRWRMHSIWMYQSSGPSVELPPRYCLGHLDGWAYLEITTQPDNAAAQAVTAKCGGKLVERYTEPSMNGGLAGLKFRTFLRRCEGSLNALD